MLLLLFYPASTLAQAVQTQDSLALVALFDATNGAGWTDHTNWLSGPVSTWFGISVTGDRVTKIVLNSNKMSGSIPAEIADLTSLQRLEFFDNRLTGPIPPELASLSNLQLLQLGLNQLSGFIPSALGNLTALQDLRLHANQFSGTIPGALGNLSNLQYLTLGSNLLSGPIPGALGNLNNLWNLQLNGNALSGSIPPELGNLSNLQYLTLGSNLLSGPIPAILGTLTNLGDLRLNGNALSGSIPPELGNLANLRILRLENNQLSSPIPPELGNLTALRILELHSNRLNGPLPPELDNLTNLARLRVGDNALSGSIPPELGNLSNLEWLELRINRLTGSVPPELGMLTNLQRLTFGLNLLEGPLPLSLIHLTQLTQIEYSGTQICEPTEPAFQAWLSGIEGSGGTLRCSMYGTQGVALPRVGEIGLFDLNEASVLVTFTDASESDGLFTINRIDNASLNLDALLSVTVESSGGPITPDVISPNRYWVALGSDLTGFTYEICLDISGLPKVNHLNRLVVVKWDDTLEIWTPRNSMTTTIAGVNYICANELGSFSQFGIASEAQYNPLPIEAASLPVDFAMAPAYPNPFNHTTTIPFELLYPSHIRLAVYDMLGREVIVLVSGHYPAGRFETKWDATGFASGVYVYRLEADTYSETKKLILQQ